MSISLHRCLRCGLPYHTKQCDRCDQLDNQFCAKCHHYNHRYAPLGNTRFGAKRYSGTYGNILLMLAITYALAFGVLQ